MKTGLPFLRQSERSSFKRCPQQWWWGYRDGLVPNKPDSGARWFGTGIHLCMAEFYVPGTVRGRDLRDTWEEFTKESYETIRIQPGFSEEGQAEYVDAKELGHIMLQEYEDEFGGDPHWEVISPEQRFNTQIPDPRPKRQGSAIVQLVGTYDLVIRDLNDGHVKMVDHKTCAHCPQDMRFLNNDGQCNTYLTVGTFSLRQLGLIGPKETIKGMEYNFLAKKKPDERPRNARGMATNLPTKPHFLAAFEAEGITELTVIGPKGETVTKPIDKVTVASLKELAAYEGITVFGEESKNQPKPTLLRHYVARTAAERNRQIQHIGNEAVIMEKFASGKLPIIKTPTKECTWCDFFELCEIDEGGGDVEDFKALAFSTRDPYMDHRDGAENSKTSAAADKKAKAK